MVAWGKTARQAPAFSTLKCLILVFAHVLLFSGKTKLPPCGLPHKTSGLSLHLLCWHKEIFTHQIYRSWQKSQLIRGDLTSSLSQRNYLPIPRSLAAFDNELNLRQAPGRFMQQNEQLIISIISIQAGIYESNFFVICDKKLRCEILILIVSWNFITKLLFRALSGNSGVCCGNINPPHEWPLIIRSHFKWWGIRKQTHDRLSMLHNSTLTPLIAGLVFKYKYG